jgi:hypothetical protein
MEIKTKITNKILRLIPLTFFLISSPLIIAERELVLKEAIPDKVAGINHFLEEPKKDTLLGYKIYNDQLGIPEAVKKEILNKPELSNFYYKNLNGDVARNLSNKEFIPVRGPDGKISFFNGSIIIKFKTLPNLNNFAASNGLSFSYSLASINRGVFKISEIDDIQLKVENLQMNNNIEEISLDIINPEQER